MGSAPSKAVKEALKEILNGLSVAEAAKRAGCDTSAIYRNKEYQKYVKSQKGNKP